MSFLGFGDHEKPAEAHPPVAPKNPESAKDTVLKQQFEAVQAHLTQSPTSENMVQTVGSVPVNSSPEVGQQSPLNQVTGGHNTNEVGPHPLTPVGEQKYAANPFGEPEFSNSIPADSVTSENPAIPSLDTHQTTSDAQAKDVVLNEAPVPPIQDKLVGDSTVPSITDNEVKTETPTEAALLNEQDVKEKLSPEARRWVDIIDDKIEKLKKERDELREELNRLEENIQAEMEAREAFMDPKVSEAVAYMKNNEDDSSTDSHDKANRSEEHHKEPSHPTASTL